MKKTARRTELVVKVRRMAHAEGLPLPAYQTDGSAGLDLVAAIPDNAPLILEPRAHVSVPTGLQMALPPGAEGQVRPRSGLAAKHGVTVLNSPGTIDADYRGEISVLLINLGAKEITLMRGDRIAQLVVSQVSRAKLVEMAVLNETARGGSGFGSTGVAGKKAPKAAKKRKSVAKGKSAAKAGAKKRGARAKR